MIPYALALGASTMQVGLLSSARNFLTCVVQLRAADMVARLGSRKAVVLRMTALQVWLWVALACVAPVFGSFAVGALVVLYTAATAFAAIGAPAWGSLVSEYVPEPERGRFFGARARLAGICTAAASLIAGGVLFLTSGRPTLGFAILCLGAAAARAASWELLSKYHEDPWREAPRLRTTFRHFIRRLPRHNFVRFACTLAAANGAAQVAAPFFAVYLLEERQLGYLAYTAVTVAGSFTGFLASPWWGRLGDRVGNQAVLRWTMLGVAPLPILWPLAAHPAALAGLNALGAFLWAGLNLSATNFLYDAVSPPKRHTGLAYFNVLSGLGVSIGALFGGWAIERLPTIGHSQLVGVFLLSTVLRLLAAVAFRLSVREVRAVRDVGLREVMLDEAEQRIVQVLGFFSVRPERELPRRRPMPHRRWPSRAARRPSDTT